LRVALLCDARAVALCAVAVEVLAVQRLGDFEIFIPGLRRLEACFLQHVCAVVKHVEIAIERHEVSLAAVGGREVPEERTNLVPFDLRVLGDTWPKLLKVPAGHVVDHPLRREHRGVDRVGAARPVREHLLVEIGERNRDDVDLRAGRLLEVGRAPLQGLLNRPSLRHDVDRDAIEFARLGAKRR
jgi:hypothetical protein